MTCPLIPFKPRDRTAACLTSNALLVNSDLSKTCCYSTKLLITPPPPGIATRSLLNKLGNPGPAGHPVGWVFLDPALNL